MSETDVGLQMSFCLFNPSMTGEPEPEAELEASTPEAWWRVSVTVETLKQEEGHLYSRWPSVWPPGFHPCSGPPFTPPT